MRSLLASAFLSVTLLAAPLPPGPPSGWIEQASAAEAVPPVEETPSPSATPSNSAAFVASICDAVAAAAAENDLPVDFFARLIWQEIHVGAENRTTAEKLCANLRVAGASYCAVQRN
jgi:hypothetical protein